MARGRLRRATDEIGEVTAPEATAPEAAAPARVALQKSVGRAVLSLDELGVLIGLGVMVAVVSSFHSAFLSVPSLQNLAQQVPLYGVMALGMVFLLSMREIDLSVGSIYGVSIVETALLMQSGWNPWLAAVIGILIGLGLGAVNGLLANLIQIPTIIVTLGTLSAFRGLALILSSGRSIGELPRDSSFFTVLGGNFLQLPVAFWVFVAVTAVLALVYHRTRYGYVIRAIGSNPSAARLAGVRIGYARFVTLVLMGGLAGLAGLLTLAFYQSADSSLGTGYELLVIASAIIGGTGLAGGRGSVVGAFLGAFMLGVISSALVQFRVSANWTGFVTGVVIIAAVGLDYVIRRRKAPTRRG
jgi:ribose transport system permease protein